MQTSAHHFLFSVWLLIASDYTRMLMNSKKTGTK